MNPSEDPLTLQDLPERRKNTELVSQLLQQELTGYLQTLGPLLTPERALGKYPGAKLDFGGVEKAYLQFLESYKSASDRAFAAPREFDPDWVTSINSKLELYRWEYHYGIKTGRGDKTITMTSPIRWLLSYASAYSPLQVWRAAAPRDEQRLKSMRQFVIDSIVLQLAIKKVTGIPQLFAALRYELATEPVLEFGNLPVAIITSSLPSFRPPDDLILAATEFSGVPAFIELIDTDAVENWEDPLKIKIQELLTAP